MLLAEEHRTRSRAVNLHVTSRAVRVLRVLVVLRSGRLNSSNVVRHAVAGQTELIHCAVFQQSRIRRSVRRVACRAAFRLHRSVFEGERSLLVGVALDTSRIRSSGQPGLLGLKSTVRVVTIGAAHRAFQNFVMEGRGKLRLDLVVTTHAELWIVGLQHANRREAGLFGIRCGRQKVRAGHVLAGQVRVRRVTIGATDVIAPVLSAPEVVPLFSARVAGQTSLRNFL